MKPIIVAGLKYLLYFCLLYGILTALGFLPSMGELGNSMYRPPTESILTRVFPSAYLQLRAGRTDVDIIRVEYISRKKIEEQRRTSNTRSMEVKGRSYEFSYYKTFLSFYIFFLTLMILSPLPLKEKIIGILIGTILYYLFSVFRVGMALAFFFNDPVADIYHASDFWVNIIRQVNDFMTLGINLLVVIILWIGLAFRKDNWERLFLIAKPTEKPSK
jgi:hypothetical protein